MEKQKVITYNNTTRAQYPNQTRGHQEETHQGRMLNIIGFRNQDIKGDF